MKHGLYTSVKRGDNNTYFGMVKAYENNRLLWSETLTDICRPNKADALQDAENLKQDMLDRIIL